MKDLLAGVLSAVLSGAVPAAPPQMTADELNRVCGRGDAESEQLCGRFIADIHAAALEAGVACDPDNTGIDAARRYLLLYTRENPQDGGRPATEVALDALSQAFPCR